MGRALASELGSEEYVELETGGRKRQWRGTFQARNICSPLDSTAQPQVGHIVDIQYMLGNDGVSVPLRTSCPEHPLATHM